MATSNVFLAVYRVECDDRTIPDTKFGQQRLRRRDLVGLLGDIDMSEYKRTIGGEGAQYLGGSAIVEIVEAAAQRLAIKCDAALSGCSVCCLKQGCMLTEHHLDLGWIEPLEDVTDRGVSRCTAPLQPEGRVQLTAMDIDEGDDAPIRVAAGYDGEDGEQQYVGKLVFLTLSTTRVGNFRQQVQERRECGHGNLRLGCRPRSQTSIDS
jgi:hypothetical protein